MLELNRILIQTDEAVKYANSGFMNKKMLAIILLDNLIEIQLLKKVEDVFWGDETTWYSGTRVFSQKERKEATHYIEGMLKFLKKYNFISEQEFSLLTFSHNIRNGVYHKAESEDYLLDIAITIYLSFVDDKIRKWKGSNIFVMFTKGRDYKQIDFGQGIDENTAYLTFNSEKYFEAALNYILANHQPCGRLIQELIAENLESQINEIQDRIIYIQDRKKSYNLYNMFRRYFYMTDIFEYKIDKNIKPKNIDSILAIINFIKLRKEELDDTEDIKKRKKKFKNLYENFKKGKKGKYGHWVDLKKYMKTVKEIKKDDKAKAIQRGLQLQNNILHLYEDVRELGYLLEAYEQDLLDFHRGK